MLLLDITAANKRRLLVTAKENETKYKALLESIPAITYIQSSGLDATLQYVGPQVERLVGYTSEEFLKDPSLRRTSSIQMIMRASLQKMSGPYQPGHHFKWNTAY